MFWRSEPFSLAVLVCVKMQGKLEDIRLNRLVIENIVYDVIEIATSFNKMTNRMSLNEICHKKGGGRRKFVFIDIHIHVKKIHCVWVAVFLLFPTERDCWWRWIKPEEYRKFRKCRRWPRSMGRQIRIPAYLYRLRSGAWKCLAVSLPVLQEWRRYGHFKTFIQSFVHSSIKA